MCFEIRIGSTVQQHGFTVNGCRGTDFYRHATIRSAALGIGLAPDCLDVAAQLLHAACSDSTAAVLRAWGPVHPSASAQVARRNGQSYGGEEIIDVNVLHIKRQHATRKIAHCCNAFHVQCLTHAKLIIFLVQGKGHTNDLFSFDRHDHHWQPYNTN
jgi:hypothetical protein